MTLRLVNEKRRRTHFPVDNKPGTLQGPVSHSRCRLPRLHVDSAGTARLTAILVEKLSKFQERVGFQAPFRYLV